MDLGSNYRQANKEAQKRLETALPQSQVNKFRIIMVPKMRRDDMAAIEDLCFYDQLRQHDHLSAEEVSYSDEILRAFGNFKRVFDSTMDPVKKFNYLLGFTAYVLNHNVWKSYECNWRVAKMVSDLARLWKKKLFENYSAEELSLDKEFSEPGVKAFLQKFKNDIEKVRSTGQKIRFDFE